MHRLAGDNAVAIEVEFVDDTQCGQVFGQRVAPGGELAVFIDQFERADPGVVEMTQRQSAA